MKKSHYFFLMSALGLMLAGCENKGTELEVKTGFSLGRNIVEMPAEGGEAVVVWMAENPIEGENVAISEDAEWLRDVDVSEIGKIKFRVDPTDLEEVPRETEVVAFYGEEEMSFKVIQAGKDPLIAFSIVRTSPTGISVSIEPKEETMNYFANVVEKEVWDTYQSDEDVIAADMEFFQYLADRSGISLEEWLVQKFDYTWALSPYCMFHYVNNGENGYRDVKPDTDYVAYCYGINGKGEILSGLYKRETSTQALDLSNPVEYDIDVVVKGQKVTMEVVPSDGNQKYNAGIFPLYQDVTDEELMLELQRRMESNLFMAWSHPENTVSWEEMLANSFYSGNKTISYEFPTPDQKGVCYAYSVDENGNICGVVFKEDFSI